MSKVRKLPDFQHTPPPPPARRPVQPLGDRVIVRMAPAETVSKGGIIIPLTAQEKPMYGWVKWAGPKCEEVKEGDQIMYGRYAGTEMQIEGIDYLLMRESDLLVVINK